MDERIQTLHPEAGKRGVHISKAKYETVRAAILDVLQGDRELTFTELDRAVAERLPNFEGSVGWYTVSVKLDLEARGVLERTKTRPHRVRIKK